LIDKVATLEEIEKHWDMDDLVRANAILDIKEQCESIMMENDDKG